MMAGPMTRSGLAARLRQRRETARRSNLWQVVQFNLDGIELERRLVLAIEDVDRDINVSSPVGKALLHAAAGERIVVEAPGGNVVVKVLEIRPCIVTSIIVRGESVR